MVARWILSKKDRALFVLAALLIGSATALLLIKTVSAAAGPRGWRQSNLDGFGNPANYDASLAVFNNQLYAGTWHSNTSPAIWRTSDGQNWNLVTATWPITATIIRDLEVFGQHLYAALDGEDGAQIQRTNGTTWEAVVTNGFTSSNNITTNALTVFSDTLYAATRNPTTGVEVWRSSSGANGSWAFVFSAGADAPGDFGFATLSTYNGYLYLGISRNDVAELWRTSNGSQWSPVFTNGLGNTDNTMVAAAEEFQGNFYIGLRNPIGGGELWRSGNGLNWTNVFTGGLGKVENSRPYGLIESNGLLYAIFSNTSTGAEIWQTADGTAWEQIMFGGWGDANSQFASYLNKGAAVFNNSLYISVGNEATGVKVWQLLHVIYLPLITRN